MIAGGEPADLAFAVWAVLAARALASIPFVRTQILRLRHATPVGATDLFQVAAVMAALAAPVIDDRVVVGTAAVVLLAAVQTGALRRPVPAAKVLGPRQMAMGLTVVAATAFGVLHPVLTPPRGSTHAPHHSTAHPRRPRHRRPLTGSPARRHGLDYCCGERGRSPKRAPAAASPSTR